jgi:hypothetical protein
MKFRTHERRISANADLTKFRVQYKVGGKARANILSSIEEARVLRDKTDTPDTKKQLKAGTMTNDPRGVMPLEVALSSSNKREEVAPKSVNLSGSKEPMSEEKKALLEMHMNLMKKVFGI